MATSTKTLDFLRMFSMTLAVRIKNAEQLVTTFNISDSIMADYAIIQFNEFILPSLKKLNKHVIELANDQQLVSTQSCQYVYSLLDYIIVSSQKELLLLKKLALDEYTIMGLSLMHDIYNDIQQELIQLLDYLNKSNKEASISDARGASSTQKANSTSSNISQTPDIKSQPQTSDIPPIVVMIAWLFSTVVGIICISKGVPLLIGACILCGVYALIIFLFS